MATWRAFGSWCPPAEPVSRSIRCVSSPTDRRESRATPLADAARRRGADVVLVTASSLPAGPGITVGRVETAAEMESAMLDQAEVADVVIMAAAVADFRPKLAATSKLHKADGLPELVLEPTRRTSSPSSGDGVAPVRCWWDSRPRRTRSPGGRRRN